MSKGLYTFMYKHGPLKILLTGLNFHAFHILSLWLERGRKARAYLLIMRTMGSQREDDSAAKRACTESPMTTGHI